MLLSIGDYDTAKGCNVTDLQVTMQCTMYIIWIFCSNKVFTFLT